MGIIFTGKWAIRYGGYTADIRRIYGGWSADIRRTYGKHTPNIRRTYAIMIFLFHNNKGISLKRANSTCGVVRSTFFKWRWIVEMILVDPSHYSSLSLKLKTNALSPYLLRVRRSYLTELFTRHHCRSA